MNKFIFYLTAIFLIIIWNGNCASAQEDINEMSPFAVHDTFIHPKADMPQDLSRIGVKWIRYAGMQGIV